MQKILSKKLYFDKNNGNTYLAKAIINIYLLKPSEALKSIKSSKILEKSDESKEILKISGGFAEILSFNFKKGINLLT